MPADLDSPAAWQALYRKPADSTTHGSPSRRAVELDAGDLKAVIPPAETPTNSAVAPSAGAAPAIDPASLRALVEQLVNERIGQMTAGGTVPLGVAGERRVSPPRAAAPQPPPTPREPRSTTSPGMRAVPDHIRSEPRAARPRSEPGSPVPRNAAFSASGNLQRPGSITSPGMRAVPDHVRSNPRRLSSPEIRAARLANEGRPSERPRSHPGLRASNPSLRRPARGQGAPPPAPEVDDLAAEPRSIPRQASNPAIPVPQRPHGAPRPRPQAGRGKTTVTTTIPIGPDLWERVPRLPGGPASLVNAGDLDQDSISVLVMVNGTTSLQELKTLVPDFNESRFLSIIRDAMKQGLIELD